MDFLVLILYETKRREEENKVKEEEEEIKETLNEFQGFAIL